MLVLPAIGAIAAAGYVYGLGPSTDKPAPRKFQRNSEQREAMHSGFLRSANRAANIIDSEETRAIRPARGAVDPMHNAAQWQEYHYAKNNKLGELYGPKSVLDNLKILRYNYSKKPGLLQLPNREGFARFGVVPNATFDRESAEAPLDERVDLYRDPFGTSGGAPIQGRSNVVLNELYVGNPWGVGGQQFKAVGNNYRNPGYADVQPNGILKNQDRRDLSNMEKLQQRVRFA